MKIRLAIVLLSLLLPACDDDQQECQSTFDCEIGQSCVDGECVTVQPEELRIESFSADQSTILLGESAVLTWEVVSAERCTINGDTVACSGATTFSPTVTMTYSLRGERGTSSLFQDLEVVVEIPDAGQLDSGQLFDSGFLDAGVADDAGPIDAGLVDAGLVDSGLVDSGLVDAGLVDAGLVDSGLVDAGLVDAGLVDSGLVDSGLVDAGAPDEVTRIVSGGSHSCAIFESGAIKCWGSNTSGQLGLGDTNNRGDEPGEMGAALPFVDLGAAVIDVAVGWNHTCAILMGGDVKCWGANGFGTLGLGGVESRGNEPNEMGANLPLVELGGIATQVAAGNDFSCALLTDGAVKCWGKNTSGQLGHGDREHWGNEPNEMGGFLPITNLGGPATMVATAHRQACALLENGDLKCWGYNFAGSLGQGDMESRGDDPNEMGTNLLAVDLSFTAALVVVVGGETSCAVSSNLIRCWGENGGKLGVGDNDPRGDEPNEMGANLERVRLFDGNNLSLIPLKVVVGGGHSCAILGNRSVKCWGSNFRGQLGNGTGISYGQGPDEMGDNLPQTHLGGLVLDIAAGGNHNCVLLEDRSVKCWGDNALGQLGLGDELPRGVLPTHMGINLPTVQLR